MQESSMAKEYLHWTDEDWATVMCSDISFSLSAPRSRIRQMS